MSNSVAAQQAYDNNAPIAAAANSGVLGRTLGERAGDIRHVCPHCGGDYATNHGALIIVQTCPVCYGVGSIADADLNAAVARMNGLV